jgi:hypothetical protein
MVRTLVSLAAGAALALTAVAAQAQSLVGTWSTTINWNTPAGVMITASFTPDGRVTTLTQNHQGQAYQLIGVYQFQGNTLQYKFTDYNPKQICGAYCQPAPAPAPLNVVYTETIQFQNANQFVGTQNGASALYVRTNNSGFPTQ